MTYIQEELREHVIERAGNRCEYCGLSQVGQEARFHIDHVVPLKSSGQTNLDNLALACVSCSLRKSARQTAIDPETGMKVSLFNPRRHGWNEHFQWEGAYLKALTPVGRATIQALDMNRTLIIAIRLEEAKLGRFPT